MAKIFQSLFCVGLIAVLPVSNSLAQQGVQQESDEDSTVTFPAAYFAECKPLTVNDMLDMNDAASMPVLSEFADQMDADPVKERTIKRGLRLMKMLKL